MAETSATDDDTLVDIAIDLTLGVISLGAAGLRAVPELAIKLPIRAAGAALVAGERVHNEYEALLERGEELREKLTSLLAGRLLGPKVADDDEPVEVDPFDSIFDDPTDLDVVDLLDDAPPVVPFVVVTPGEFPADDGLPVAGFDLMSIGALRARVRQVDIGELETLLAHELTHGARPAVLELLETRIAQLQQEQSAD